MESLLLDNIDQPSDLKNLDKEQVNKLCAEIRQFLLRNISRTGGHLASNLGAVELTVALHRVMTTPMDKIVFDVGHQCYTHKLLTGRRSGFAKLRQLDGISGFPNPNESEHDAFIAGHGNTALSLSIGMAWAKKIRHEPGWVVAVIGDGAFTGGMVYEGMNNIGSLDNLLVILNDNKMSISHNVGALARYLTHLRTTTAYFDAKDNVRSFLDSVPVVGTPLKKALTEGKTLLRRAMYHSTMFEDMGFQYIGPVDGHNEEELERTLRTISQRPGPHFLHVVTKKGKGYQPAEMNPGNYHGVSAFDPDGMPDPEVAPKESFSTTFGQALAREAAQNSRICAITAAMKYGTGLQFFSHSAPERFFDVGMAEQHAVTFAAGLASQGMLPVVCIYSTFLQQAIDFSIYCDDILVEHYRGDGVIVATPTGSTAYSRAAGGPILDSQTKGVVVTPICPHSLASPAMVFAQERKLNICVGQVADGEVFISCDGAAGFPLKAGATAEVRLSDQVVQLITFSKADQFQAIDQKLRSRR